MKNDKSKNAYTPSTQSLNIQQLAAYDLVINGSNTNDSLVGTDRSDLIL